MSKLPTLTKLGRKADKLLDSRQKARFRQLNAIERLLFAKLIEELRKGLEESNGRITSKKGFVSTGKAVDAIFDAVEEKLLVEMAASTVKDMRGVLDMNARYYGAMGVVKGGPFAKIKSSVDQAMRKRLGIGKEDDVQKGGFLDQLFGTSPARDDIKKMVAKSVSAGIPMRKLEKQLKVAIQGTKDSPGVLERHVGGFVLDAYQVADSITNNEFAKRLDLKYFVYSGGLIETSRQFCRKRNNQVFSTEEAQDWENDPTLPRTKAERLSGLVVGYNPLEDRGRWRCRHRLLYISEQQAFARRPELRKKAAK